VTPAVWAILAISGLVTFAVWGYATVISRNAQVRHRAWAMRWRIWLRLRPGYGFATVAELWMRWGRIAALSDGARGRPGMPFRVRVRRRTTDYAVRFGRAQWGRRTYGRLQDQVLILAPPQSGKSGLLAERILAHPGPVVCTSTRDDLFTNTAGLRSRRGPVHTFNPLGIGGIPSTFGWDIVAGCEDPSTAIRRGQDLTGDYETGDLKWWQSKASAALAAMLHAAALGGHTMLEVYAWVNGRGDAQAEEILDTHPLASPALRSVMDENRDGSKTAGSVRATISEALTWVAVPALAAAVHPAPGAWFDVAQFVRGNGTLYLIAPGNEVSPIAPLFAAFVSHLHYEAGLHGSRTEVGKVDPPLLLALDELTQICPIPLPSLLADSAGKGILIAAVIHSIGQLETRWGKYGADTIWSTCGTKMLLTGITDTATLEHVSRLTGTVGVKVKKDTHEVPVMPPELLRMLPKWRALILSLNHRPVVVKTRPVWHRWDRRLGRRPAAPPVLTPARLPRPVITLPLEPAPEQAEVPNGQPAAGH
jgi:type IV secretion system protein VirD4